MSAIIVEGPDGAGKTTLIGSLAPMLGAAIFHNGAYIGEPLISHHYFGQLYYAVATPWKTVIMDRSWLAEPIYGDAMRNGENRISPNDRANLEDLARRTRAVLILCLPSFDVCRTAWMERVLIGKEYLDQEAKLQRVHTGYTKLDPGPMPMMRYDYTSGLTVNDVYDWVANHRGER